MVLGDFGWFRVLVITLFKVNMLERCLLTVLELIWNQRMGHKKTKLNICHHMLTSSTQLQNRSFSSSNMQICGVYVAVVIVVA